MKKPNDFDYWKTLYEKDPAAFDAERQQVLNEIIATRFPDDLAKQQRLRASVWAMDQRVAKIKHPLAKLMVIKDLFWSQYAEFQRVLLDGATTLKGKRPGR